MSEYDGINITQQQFNCRNEANFRHGFATKVGLLLQKIAVPYLDHFQSVADIIPVIRHQSFLGFALHHVGRTDEAIAILKQERDRLKELDMTNQDIVTLLENVEQKLVSVYSP